MCNVSRENTKLDNNSVWPTCHIELVHRCCAVLHLRWWMRMRLDRTGYLLVSSSDWSLMARLKLPTYMMTWVCEYVVAAVTVTVEVIAWFRNHLNLKPVTVTVKVEVIARFCKISFKLETCHSYSCCGSDCTILQSFELTTYHSYSCCGSDCMI